MDVKEIVAKLIAGNRVLEKRANGYWSFIFTKQSTNGMPVNYFTAKFFGSSDASDWALLGFVAKQLGVPRDVVEKGLTLDPTDTQRFMWKT